MSQETPSSLSPSESAHPQDVSKDRVGALKLALRRARDDDAERSGARAELRAARLGRLELLQDALQPLVSQISPDIDIFDVALVPSSDPRLFIDMIGFVEMARDAHCYHLQQDTRHGRIRVAESESVDGMVDAVADYIARRLLERDKALASDARARWSEQQTQAALAPTEGQVHHRPRSTDSGVVPAPASIQPERLTRGTRLHSAGLAFAFLIDLLGAITFFMIIGALGWYVWLRMHAPT